MVRSESRDHLIHSGATQCLSVVISIPGLSLFISRTWSHKVFIQPIASSPSSSWSSQSTNHQCKSSCGCFWADLVVRIFSSWIVFLSRFRPLAFALSPLTALHNSCLSMALPGLDLLIERKDATTAQPPGGLLVEPAVGQQPAKRSAAFRTALVAPAVSCALLNEPRHLASNLAFLIGRKGPTAMRWIWKPCPAPDRGGQRCEVGNMAPCPGGTLQELHTLHIGTWMAQPAGSPILNYLLM